MQSAVGNAQTSQQRLPSGKAKIVNGAERNEKCADRRVSIQPDGRSRCARLPQTDIIISGFGFPCNSFCV